LSGHVIDSDITLLSFFTFSSQVVSSSTRGFLFSCNWNVAVDGKNSRAPSPATPFLSFDSRGGLSRPTFSLLPTTMSHNFQIKLLGGADLASVGVHLGIVVVVCFQARSSFFPGRGFFVVWSNSVSSSSGARAPLLPVFMFV